MSHVTWALNLSCSCKMSEAGADQMGQLQNYTVDQLICNSRGRWSQFRMAAPGTMRALGALIVPLQRAG